MQNSKFYIVALCFLFWGSAFAQVQVDHAIQLTGAGANAKINGIKSVTDSLDATSAAVIQNGSLIYAVASGTGNNFNITISPPVAAYQAGMVINFISNQGINGAATLNVNNLGAKPIKKLVNQDFTGCEILNGQVVSVVYDGTNFQIISFLAPALNITATPSAQSIVSNTATSIALTAGVPGTTYSWTVTESGVSGASAGAGSSIAQTLVNPNLAPGTATYTVTAMANGCSVTGNVVVTVTSPAFGAGADGPVTVSANTNLNTGILAAGRTCPDAVNYSVTALTANTATLSSAPNTGCLAAGDEVLLINLQGTSTNTVNVGNYETLKILSVSGTLVTFKTNKINYYGNNASDDSNIGTASSNQRVMLQRVPNYTSVTVNAGDTLTANAWNDVLNGVLFFRASGAVTNNGAINMSADGYLGGAAGIGYGGTSLGIGGESFCGVNAGSGGYYSGPGNPGSCGGGGGGGVNRSSSSYSGAAGSATGGAGAGGGSLYSDNGGNTGDIYENAGAGGGGGYGSAGTGGGGYGAGGNGGTNTSGAGGSSSFSGTEGSGGEFDYGGGGGGGGSYGNANLSVMFFGSAGAGSGGSHDFGVGAIGGNGGGIIFIGADNFENSGSVISSGANGNPAADSNGGSGGGAGGSIYIAGDTVTLSSTGVAALGGSGGSGTYTGGAGGNGLIAVYYHTSTSGTTNPAAYSQQVP